MISFIEVKYKEVGLKIKTLRCDGDEDKDEENGNGCQNKLISLITNVLICENLLNQRHLRSIDLNECIKDHIFSQYENLIRKILSGCASSKRSKDFLNLN